MKVRDGKIVFLDVYDREASNYDVIDKDTGKRISRVQWADLDRQRFEVVVCDKNGEPILDEDGCIIKRIKKGKIKLVRKSEVKQ